MSRAISLCVIWPHNWNVIRIGCIGKLKLGALTLPISGGVRPEMRI